jgi:dihydrofolate reductase
MARMRRIVMFNRVTADGYFAGPDGNLDWVVPDVELDRSAAAAIQHSDTDTATILFGRRTYQQFEAFWPHALDGSSTAANPHDADGPSREMRAMAVMLNESTKLVFSRTLKEVTWKNSHLLHELDPREVQAMKRQSGSDMLVFGSSSIVSQLTQHGLIDEYQIVVNPVLLGSGQPLLSGMSTSVRLDLLKAREFPSGNVLLRYARSRPAI